MELKTIKEFAHKNNLGEGLKFENGLFQLNLDGEFNTIASSLNQLNTKVNQINEQLGTVYKVKGSTTVDTINSMTVGNAMIGYVYNLLDSGVITNGIDGELNVVKGSNIVYTEEGWDEFAVSLDLDQCAGQNISIESNIISALGYRYDPYYDSFTTGKYTNALGENSHAEGHNTQAKGAYSHTEGLNTEASGSAAHAEGYMTRAEGYTSHAEGQGTKTFNRSAHSEGGSTTAYGTYSHAEGLGTLQSLSKASFEENSNEITFTSNSSIRKGQILLIKKYDDSQSIYVEVNSVSDDGLIVNLSETIPFNDVNCSMYIVTGIAYGNVSHSEGYYTTSANGPGSHAEGCYTIASGQGSHTEGVCTITDNDYEHAQGKYNKSNTGETEDTKTIHSIGIGSDADNRKNAFEVMQNGDHYIIGIGGYDGTNPDTASTLQDVINNNIYTAGQNIKIENSKIEAVGYTYDSDKKSFVTGYGTIASGSYSHAEGDRTKAYERAAHAEGYYAQAYGIASHAEGDNTMATGDCSHAEGYDTGTNNRYEHAQGVRNVSNQNSDTFGDAGNTIHSIGIGTSGSDYKNAQEVMQNGDHYIIGIGDYDGTNINEALTLQEVINELNNKEIPNEIYVGTTVEGEPTIFIDTDEENDIEVYTKDQVDSLITDVRKDIDIILGPDAGVASVNGQTGIVKLDIPTIDHLATREELTSEVSTLNEKISNIVHPEDLVKSVNGQVGEVVLEIPSVEGLATTEELNSAISGLNIPSIEGLVNSDTLQQEVNTLNQKIDNLNIPTLPENIVNTINGQTGDVVLPDTSTLATKEEVQAVNTRIDELNIPSDLSNVVTKTDNYQVTLGTDNNATHEKTLLVGTGLTTSNNESLVVGAYNNSEYFVNWGVDAPAIQVGAGTEDSKRTVMVVQKNGKSLGLLGFEQNGFGDFAEYFEWYDGNPEGEDRVGYMVQLNEDKIELAESLDNCIGIITGTGSFVADAACLDWHGRYLKDKWGRNIYELTGVLAENPDYDPTKEYIPREYRKEWSPVGLVGKILVRQDGTLKPNGFVGCVNGIATNVDKSSWRVLKVIDEEIALILIK